MAKAPKKTPEYQTLLDKIKRQSTIPLTTTLEECKFLNDKDTVPTPIPVLNALLNGKLDGGFSAGIVQVAGKSRMFKTGLVLLAMKSFLTCHPDGVALFYINEFGSPSDYFKVFGIDPKRVIVTPITDIEQLRHDIMVQLDGFVYGKDRVFIAVDSIGNLASKKEVDDVLKGSEKADMTRAKQLKSLGRLITPHLTLKNIPLWAVNHVYKDQSGGDPKYAKTIISGGSGMFLSSDNIYLVTRQNIKTSGDDKELIGFLFNIYVHKARLVKEGLVLSLRTMFKGGISKWSGLLELALDSGHVQKSKDGAKNVYGSAHTEKFHTLEETDTSEFWDPILADQTFKDYIETTFKLAQGEMEALT